MYKKVELVENLSDWFKSDYIVDVRSVSGCISKNFTDYTNHWKHNEWWLFDSPTIIEKIATGESIDLSGMTLFYYEMHGEEYNDTTNSWGTPVSDWQGLAKQPGVILPREKRLDGFDVATFSCGNAPECSPLSCNGLHERISVNQHCLFNSFDEAKNALDGGLFRNSEPGPYRIFAVYTVLRF
jgi:hypothetical protein